MEFRYLFERKNLFGLGFAVIALLVGFLYVRPLLFTGLFVALNFVFGYTMGKARMVFHNVGFELVTFSTILAGFAFGPIIGLLVGVLSRFAEMLSMKRMFSAAVTVPLYGLLGVVAGVLEPTNIIFTGISLMIGFVIVTTISTFFLLGGRVPTMILFGATQAIFNAFLIVQIYPVLFRLLTI